MILEASPIHDTALMLDIMFIIQGLSGKFIQFHPLHDTLNHTFHSNETVGQVRTT